jgi:hypothetical protein
VALVRLAASLSLRLCRRLPFRRPIFPHALAGGFPSGSGHPPSRLLSEPLTSPLRASRQDERDRQVVLVERISEMREQSDQMFGFLHQFAESDFGATLGKFENMRRMLWHRSMRISERLVSLKLVNLSSSELFENRLLQNGTDFTRRTILTRFLSLTHRIPTKEQSHHD